MIRVEHNGRCMAYPAGVDTFEGILLREPALAALLLTLDELFVDDPVDTREATS